MKTKTIWHRLPALALCLVLLVSLFPGRVQAAPPENSDLTVSGLEEDLSMTVSAYQIITVSFENGQPEAPMYSWNPAIADWVRTNYSTYIESDGSVSAVFAWNQNGPHLPQKAGIRSRRRNSQFPSHGCPQRASQ